VRLLIEVGKFIRKQNLLFPNDRVLVAVSGGPDSVALLHGLHGLREELRLELEVAHLQHGIRGEEARADARFVAALAEGLGLPFHLKEIDLPALKTAAGKGNLEELARAARYRFFSDVARRRRLNKVATAHTRDDQAETVLMWLLRGSGLRGLGGMAPVYDFKLESRVVARSLTVVRPLLDVSKTEVLAFLDDRRIAYRIDRTNQDTRLLRNWIRWELMPKLKERNDPHFAARLAHQAELLRDDEWVLESLARRELEQIRRGDRLDRELFLKQPAALQRRLLRLWIGEARRHLRGVDFAHVAALLEFIAGGPPQGRLAVPGGMEVIKEYRVLRLDRRHRRKKRAPCYSYELRVGAPLNIPEAGVTIVSERLLPPTPMPDSLAQAVFDSALLPATLTMRNFRRGDRFQPLGMAGHRKVKDLFIEKKIPLSVRAALPLLSAEGEILWIPGYGRSDVAKIGRQTSAIVSLRVVSMDGLSAM